MIKAQTNKESAGFQSAIGNLTSGIFHSIHSVNSVNSVNSVKNLCALCVSAGNLTIFDCAFAKRTHFVKSVTNYLSTRSVIFSAVLAQKTNPKRTHFSASVAATQSPLRLVARPQGPIFRFRAIQSSSKPFKDF